MPTIDFTEPEHAAIRELIKRAIKVDGFRSPRGPLRSAQAKLGPKAPPPERGGKQARR
jgi:hypothetical protein